MLSLSDRELDVVMALAAPLDVTLRDPFLRAVAIELEKHQIIGEGLVFRTAKALQREFLRPPAANGLGFASEYR